MKVVLLNPPTAFNSRGVLLNLAYLSAKLKQEGHIVKIIDAIAPYNTLSESEVKNIVEIYKPDFIGITLPIDYLPDTYDFIKYLSSIKIPIVAGGPHANCLPEEVLNHSVDIVVLGEGENTIIELTDYFLGKKKLEDVSGICYKSKDGSFKYTKQQPLIHDLDSIPFPDLDSFPIKNYTGSNNPSSSPTFWSIFSSRGCPYNCTFCSSHNVFGRNYRSRSPKNIVKEIEEVSEKYGAHMFAFQDDEAFIDKKRIIEFCNLIKEKKLNLKFSARMRIDNLDVDMLRNMKYVGFKRLAFGIESLNDETLLKVNKMYKVKNVFEGFEILKEVRFRAIHFNLIIGFPWETPEHLNKNFEEIKKFDKSHLLFISTVNPVPYPGTKLYEDHYKEYEFDGWWLDEKRNSKQPQVKSFFMLFMFSQFPLFKKDLFWNYSPEMEKAIEKFCFDVASYCLKQHYSLSLFLAIYYLCKASHLIWKKAPLLERILFYPLKKIVEFTKLDKRMKFVNYY